MATLREFIRDSSESLVGSTIRESLNNPSGSDVFTQNNFNLYMNSYFSTNTSPSVLTQNEHVQLMSRPDADEIAVGVWDRIVQVAPVVGSYGEFVKDKLLTTFKFNSFK